MNDQTKPAEQQIELFTLKPRESAVARVERCVWRRADEWASEAVDAPVARQIAVEFDACYEDVTALAAALHAIEPNNPILAKYQAKSL